MDKKLCSIIIVLIAMVSTAIFLVWGYFWNAWDSAWIIYVFTGIAIAAVSMIGKYTREKKEKDD